MRKRLRERLVSTWSRGAAFVRKGDKERVLDVAQTNWINKEFEQRLLFVANGSHPGLVNDGQYNGP